MKKIYFLCSFMLLVAQTKAQWVSLNAPKASYETYQFLTVSDDGKNFFSFMSDMTGKGYFVTSHDYGNTWQKYYQPATNYTVHNAPIASGYTFWEGDVLYYVDFDKVLRKSTDFGATCSIQNNTYSTQSIIVHSPAGKWFKQDSSKQLSSTDKGVTWVANNNLSSIFIDFVIANNGNIVATCNAGVIYSTNGGDSWDASTLPNTNLRLPYNSISKATDGTLLIFYASSSLVLKSTDNGVSWQQVNSTLPANTKILQYSGNDIISYSILGDTYKSTDGGLTFTSQTTTNLSIVSGMISANSNVYIFGMSGISRYGNAVNTGIAELKSDTKLTVFPNPCHDVITLQAENPICSYTITNLAGQLVSKNTLPLTNQIDVSSISKGIYLFTTIAANGEKSTVRLVKQ